MVFAREKHTMIRKYTVGKCQIIIFLIYFSFDHCMTANMYEWLAIKWKNKQFMIPLRKHFNAPLVLFMLSYSISVNQAKSGSAYLFSTKNNHLFPFSCNAYHADHRYKTMRTTGSDRFTLASIQVNFMYNTWPTEMLQHNRTMTIKLRFVFRSNQDHCDFALQRFRKCLWVQRVPPFVWLYLSCLPKRCILHFIFQKKLH